MKNIQVLQYTNERHYISTGDVICRVCVVDENRTTIQYLDCVYQKEQQQWIKNKGTFKDVICLANYICTDEKNHKTYKTLKLLLYALPYIKRMFSYVVFRESKNYFSIVEIGTGERQKLVTLPEVDTFKCGYDDCFFREQLISHCIVCSSLEQKELIERVNGLNFVSFFTQWSLCEEQECKNSPKTHKHYKFELVIKDEEK